MILFLLLCNDDENARRDLGDDCCCDVSANRDAWMATGGFTISISRLAATLATELTK